MPQPTRDLRLQACLLILFLCGLQAGVLALIITAFPMVPMPQSLMLTAEGALAIIAGAGAMTAVQGIEDLNGAFAVFHQDAFGQLQFQVFRCKTGVFQNRPEHRQKARAVELQRRQVHRHTALQQPHLKQPPGVFTRLGGYPLAQVGNLAGFLGYGKWG